MLVGAMQTGTAKTNRTTFYDAHADWELSRLLTVLDEQASSSDIKKDAEKLREIKQFSDICEKVLEDQTASAEVFIQLAQRAIKRNDYKKLDELADVLTNRFSAGEIAEIIRQTDMPQIRAIAYETLSLLPTSAIAAIIDDSIYTEIAVNALEQQAFEYESEEARDFLEQLNLDEIGELKFKKILSADKHEWTQIFKRKQMKKVIFLSVSIGVYLWTISFLSFVNFPR